MKYLFIAVTLFVSTSLQAEVEFNSQDVQKKILHELELANIQLKELISILIEMNGKLISLEKNVDDLHNMMIPQAYNNEGNEIPWR